MAERNQFGFASGLHSAWNNFYNSAASFGRWLGNNLDPTGSKALENQVAANSALWQQNADFAAQEAQKDRDFQERMSSTAYQRAFKDLEAAGYNPYIALTAGSAASTPGGASASSSAASVSRQDNKLFDTAYKLADSIVKAGQSSSASTLSAVTRIASLAILAL